MRNLVRMLAWFSLIISFRATAEDLSLVSAKERLRYLRYSKIERSACLRMQRHGISAGARTYRQAYRSCTDFLLAGGGLENLLHPIDLSGTRDEQCYEGGYREGLAKESVRQWLPCSDQYMEALKASNAKLIEQCKALANQTNAATSDFAKELMEGLDQTEDPETMRGLAHIYYMTELGYGYKVWDEVLELVSQPNVSKATCSLILASTMTGTAL